MTSISWTIRKIICWSLISSDVILRLGDGLALVCGGVPRFGCKQTQPHHHLVVAATRSVIYALVDDSRAAVLSQLHRRPQLPVPSGHHAQNNPQRATLPTKPRHHLNVPAKGGKCEQGSKVRARTAVLPRQLQRSRCPKLVGPCNRSSHPTDSRAPAPTATHSGALPEQRLDTCVVPGARFEELEPHGLVLTFADEQARARSGGRIRKTCCRRSGRC